MPIAKFELPDGRIARFEVPEGTTPEQAQQMIVPMLGTLPPPPPGVGEQLLGAPKAFVKGIGSSLATTAGGIAGLGYAGARAAFPELAPFSETAVGRAITGAEEYFAPSDEGFITQVAGGLGSLASIAGPQVALRGLGAAGRFGGFAPRAAAPVGVAQTAGLGAGEARQRVEIAREEGIDVTPGQELAALGVGVPIGLLELMPVERLFKGLGAGLDEGFKFTVANLVKRGFQQGGVEGAQEVASGLLQDLSAKGIYNPNLEVGESMLNEFAVGSTVGAIAQTGLDVLLRKDITKAYQNRLRRESEERLQKETDALRQQEQEQIAQTKENLGIQDQQVLALPAPAPQIEAEEEVDPLMNPVGYFNANELTPEYLKAVNDIRTKEGKARISQFSVEDLADAGAPQAEIDRLLAYKTGYDATAQQTKLSGRDIFNIATEKNIDVSTPGFADFLRRTTGQPDVTKMSQPQLFAAFNALSAVEPSETLQVLPQGTNATRFTQDQYDKTIKSLTDLFPSTNLLGKSSVLQEIKDYSGLENDRDAESLLQTAIRKGDLDTVSNPRYDVVDSTGKTVRTYLTRDSAERAARKENLSVREGTSINIALPGSATQLPGGPDIRKGTFKEGVAPSGFEVFDASGKKTGITHPSQEAAEKAADKYAEIRGKEAQEYVSQADNLQRKIDANVSSLQRMEALGNVTSLEYAKASANIFAKNKKFEQDKNNLLAKANELSQPLTIGPRGQKPVTREGYTLFQDGKPVATFPDQKRAEEAAIATLSDEQIDGIINKAPELKGLMPKRLRKMALDEKTRRQQSSEIDMTYGPRVRPIEVAFTGDRAAAEQRLREVGLNIRFASEVQDRLDELDKKLRPLMDRLGLKDVRLKIVEAIKTPVGDANASYAAKLITVALNSDDPVRALRHEGVHALKELGFFTPQQWRVLENKAKEEWVNKYNIAGRYQGLGLNQDEIFEEAIADAFSDFDQTKAPAGLVGAIFKKIKDFLNALGNGFRGLGFQTADDVFTRIEEGRLTGAAPGVPGKRFSLQEPRIMGTGKIVGAPPGRNTEADREALINEMVQLLEDPFTMFNESRFWYENSGQTIREMTRSDPALMERVVRLLSLYSQANSLGGNTTATIKSIAQLAQGQPTALAGRFPNETAKRIPAILSAPTMDSTLPGVDDKLMNFYRNLRDATFQDDTFADASTVDRWMMRLFGYPHAEDQEIGGATGVSNTQYIYAKDLLQRIANIESERTGETILPRQIQAALWTYVRNKTEFDSLPPEKQATFQPKNVDFADYVTRATANITWESRPSTKINLIPGIHKAPRDDQEAFNRAVRNIFVNPNTGEDKIFKLLDNQQLYSSEFSMGAYENLITPNIITRLVLQKDDGEYLTSVADNYAAIVGYVTKQDAVPWYRADPTATGKDASVGYRVTPSVASTPEFENRLFEYLNEKMPGVGFTRIGGSFDFVNYRGEDGKPFFMADKKYIEKLQDALRMFASDVDFNVVPFRAKSGWISNDWKENPDGQGYLDRLRNAGLGDLQRVIDGWSKDYDQIANDFGREFGWSKFSLKSDESIGGPSIGSGISIRPQQPTAQSFDAVHYGKQRVNTLVGSMYGTGIKGAEARRVFSAPDPRIRQRAYFYIPFENGRMPKPEAGLGQEVHVQRLNNLLGPGPEMQALASAARIEGQFDENAFESSVIDAGYDGYAVPSMGMAVVLGENVPVQPRGTRQEVEAKPEKDKIQIGDRKYSLQNIKTKTEFQIPSFAREIPETSEEIDRIYDYLEEQAKKAGFRVEGGSSNVSGSRYLTIIEDLPDDNVRDIQVRISNHGDRYPSTSASEGKISIDPSRGGIDLEQTLYQLQDKGFDLISQVAPVKNFVNIGGKNYSLRNTDTKEFKQWFGYSTITNPDGSPKVMYHGTARDIETFVPKQANAIFLTNNPRFAETFTDMSEEYMVNEMFNQTLSPEQRTDLVKRVATKLYKEKEITKSDLDFAVAQQELGVELGFLPSVVQDSVRAEIVDMLPSGKNIMPLYVRAEDPFDYENPNHIKEIQALSPYDLPRDLQDGSWRDIESYRIQELIKEAGFDSFYVKEGGVKNLAVYDPNQIKSAIGNFGTYSRTNNDIRFSLALEGLKPSSALIPDEGGNPSGNLGFMPEKLGGKPIRLLVGTHSDTVDELANEKMYRPVSYGGNHILNRIMSYPKREPIGAEELLEKIVRAAQKTSQTYTRIYKEGGRYILFDGRNSLILGENPDSMSIITMYTQTDPNRRYGNPAWFGRAPVVPEFVGKIRGTKVEAKEGRIAPSEADVKAKRVYTPSDIAAIAAEEPTRAPTKGTLTLGKKLSLAGDFQPVDTESANFKRFFGKSKVVGKDGKPKVMYHGTDQDISEFVPGEAGIIFVSPDPEFAGTFTKYSEERSLKKLASELDENPEQKRKVLESVIETSMANDSLTNVNSPYYQDLAKAGFIKDLNQYTKDFWLDKFMSQRMSENMSAVGIKQPLEKLMLDSLKTGRNILPVYVSAQNPFDYDNRSHVIQVMKKLASMDSRYTSGTPTAKAIRDDILNGRWQEIENTDVQDAIKELGFDSFYTKEQDTKNLGLFSPSQIKSAVSNTGEFSLADRRIQYSVRDSLPADIADAIDRTTTARETRGFGQRIAESFSPTAFTRFRQGMINKYESIERLARAAADSPKDLLADTSSIAAALFADRAAGVAAASFGANDRVGGIPVYKNGFTQISNENNTVKGLIPIFEPLAKYGDPYVFQAFQYYAGTRRGKRLMAEGREKVFTPEDIKRGQLLEQQYPEFKQAFDDYQKYNEGIVQFLVDTGVLSQKEADIWMQNADYIPFYRQMEGEEGGLVGPKVFSPIAGVAKPKKLKGGEAPLADFMETVVRNSRAAIEAGMKNVAGQRVVRDMLKLNQAEAVPVVATGSDIVTVKENGLTKHYRVADPLLVESLKGLNLPQLPFLEILAKPSEVLRNLVTKDPGFMLANLTRDSLQAWVTTGVSMTPIVDTYKQFGKALANMSPEVKALANGGLFAGYDFSGDVKSSAEEVERALRERTGTRTTIEKATRLTGLPQIWNALDKGSTASDVATRAEVYKKVLAETGNEAEAMYQAMEVLNFSRKGNSALIRVVTALVPFMNARIQGLDVLYRASFGKMATATRERQQKAFMVRGMTLFALSSLYWMLASDTEEYKTATPEARDNNWIIGSVRVPIPFEIGTIFKVFPERIYEYFFGMDTGRDLKDSIVRNITSTLAFNPIPQAFLPAVENIANYSFFTGEPIVGRGMQDVAAPYQVSSSTSLLAQQVGKATGQSPMMIDNLIRGYTGTIGTYVVQALDAVMRGENDPPKPAMGIEQFPVLKRFFASPQGSGTIDAYYNMKQRVDEATRTINFLERTGGTQDLQEYLEGKGGKLIMIKPYIQAMEKDMKSLREMRRAVQASQIDADQKRQILDSIRASEVAITSRMQYVKKLVD